MAESTPKMECPQCGYKSHPQWLNDRAHCLKCDAVLMTRDKTGGAARDVRGAVGTARAPGEVSTHKYSASDAMESESGVCKSSPNGMHHFKFGKCTYCRAPEGKLVSGGGAMQNPGGADECSRGGKCMFKFAKCTKCGRGEGGVSVPKSSGRVAPKAAPKAASGRPGSREKIMETFRQFDADGNGIINLAELRAVLQRLPVPAGGRRLTDADFDKFLSAMDENHDGVVDMQEFTHWLHSDPDTAASIMGNMKATSGAARAAAKPAAAPARPVAKAPSSSPPRGPERFFYDKSSYTGTHAKGGPEHVAVGAGTVYDQSWKRSS